MDAPPTPRIGHDLVDVARFAGALERHGEGFRDRVFTQQEWAAADGRPDAAAVLAARFAAKEAAFKALGTGWGQGVAWRDVEVLGGRRSPPRLVLTGRARERLEGAGLGGLAVSLSHTATLASATVLAWPARA